MGAVPFVGRDGELATLVRLIDSARSRRGVDLAVVTGDAGSGKSRLLSELISRLDGRRVLRMAGWRPERTIPFAAARGLLAELASVPHEGQRISRLLEPGPSVRPPDPIQVCEAAHRCLSAQAPAALLVDDLQWLDDLSGALLHYLVRGAGSAEPSLPVVIACRPGASSQGLVDSLAKAMAESGRSVHLRLGPLDRASGMYLCRQANPALTTADLEQIWERSEGSPFWLVTLSRAGAGGPDSAGDPPWGLAGLTPVAATVATILAVLAKPTFPAMLADLSGWPVDRVDQAVEELVDRGLVVTTGMAVRLAHELVTTSILAGLPDEVVRRAHARISDHLQAFAEDRTQQLTDALWHRRAAGMPCGGLALRLTRSPGRRLLGPSDVRAMADIADDPREAGEPSAELRWQLARLASEIGNPALALEAWSSLLLHVNASRDRGRVALEASKAALALGDRSQARALADTSRREADADPLLRIELDAHLSEVEGTSRAESEIPMRRAVAGARAMAAAQGGPHGLDAGERRAFLTALQSEFFFTLREEDPPAMMRIAEEMQAASDTVDDRLRAMLLSVLALRALGRYEEAERRCRTARLTAVRETLPARAFEAGHLLAGTLYHLGLLLEARSVALEVIAFADRAPVVLPSWVSVAWVRTVVPQVDMSVRGLATALPALESLAESEPDPHFRLQIWLEAGLWTARLGAARDRDRAGSFIERALADARAARCDRCASELSVRAAEAFVRLGRDRDARDLLSAWDAAHPRTIASGQIGFWRLRAEALLVAGHDAGRALDLLESVCARADEMDARLEKVWAQIDLGRVATDTDRGRAIAALQAAITLADGIGAQSEQRRARQLLRAVGVRSWQPPLAAVSPSSGALTGRELEIGRMVATGASNPEIAEALFVSRKTVERHVSTILDKTGTRNRAELAALLSVGAVADRPDPSHRSPA